MLAWIIGLRLLAVSQVVLFGISLGLSRNPVRLRVSGVAIALCVTAYLLLPLAYAYLDMAWLTVLLAVAADAIPVVLVLFVWSLFQDDLHVPRWLQVLLLVYAVFLAGAHVNPGGGFSLQSQLFRVLYQLLKLAIAASAVVIVWAGRTTDLVEARLALRRYFVVVFALVVIAVASVELVSGWQVPIGIELVGMGLIFAVALWVNIAQARAELPFFLIRHSGVALPRADDRHPPLVKALIDLMTQERLYAEHDLSIGQVDRRINVAEHKLRRTINQELGFRNFNQFINGFRIEEATRRLIADGCMPILTIALDVGFRSISSFNNSFRAHHDCSPTKL